MKREWLTATKTKLLLNRIVGETRKKFVDRMRGKLNYSNKNRDR